MSKRSRDFSSIPVAQKSRKKSARTGGFNRPTQDQMNRANAMTRQIPGNFQPTGAEIKAIDIVQSGLAYRLPATATNLILLNGIQAGAGFFNRIASRIEMRNLHIRGTVNNVTTSFMQTLRLLVVYDRQPTGALPVVSDILQSRTQTGAPTTSGVSEINLDFRDRFTIIRDIEHFAPSATNTAGAVTNAAFQGVGASFAINEFIKLKGLGCHFKSTTSPTAIADIATGALYAMFVSDIQDSAWQANVGFRLRFDDK